MMDELNNTSSPCDSFILLSNTFYRLSQSLLVSKISDLNLYMITSLKRFAEWTADFLLFPWYEQACEDC